MEYNNKLEVAIEREYKVVKANEIIQKARTNLSMIEQKTFCYAVSKIKPDDKLGTWYSFAINDYCDVCGINRNDGRTIENVKEALKSLRDKSFYMTDENGDSVLIGWLDKARISPKSGKVKIRFDEDMQKYLVGLQENYTQYSLLCVLPMRSGYSIRIYELLKSYLGQSKKNKIEKEFDIDDLKGKLLSPYVNFKDFRKKVLEVAIKEINLYTDIEVSWEPINQGRKVIKVKFNVVQRDTWGKLEAMYRANDILEGQLTIKDLEMD